MKIVETLRKIKFSLNQAGRLPHYFEQERLLIGKLLAEEIKKREQVESLKDVEFQVFSQWGDDGIIQFIINNVEIPNKTFIEFGVEDYRESSTRFLLMNDNWSGLVMDQSEENVSKIIHSEYYWKYELKAKAAFVTSENINDLIREEGFDKDVGILHIDIDGNDYWVWKAIDVITPDIVIVEYNSVMGIDRAITVPYEYDFQRTRAHYSNLYFGSSLRALHHLGNQKGYAFIGCNSAGSNAYFVRKDRLNTNVREVSLENGYVQSKLRESRDKNGNLTYITGEERLKLIRGMPVFNVENEQLDYL